jgi:hypothetical protein
LRCLCNFNLQLSDVYGMPYLAIPIMYLTSFSSSTSNKTGFLPLFLERVCPITWHLSVFLGMSKFKAAVCIGLPWSTAAMAALSCKSP